MKYEWKKKEKSTYLMERKNNSSSLTLSVHGKIDDLNGRVIWPDSNWKNRTFRVWSTRAIMRLSFALVLYSDVTFSIPDWQLRCLQQSAMR